MNSYADDDNTSGKDRHHYGHEYGYQHGEQVHLRDT